MMIVSQHPQRVVSIAQPCCIPRGQRPAICLGRHRPAYLPPSNGIQSESVLHLVMVEIRDVHGAHHRNIPMYFLTLFRDIDFQHRLEARLRGLFGRLRDAMFLRPFPVFLRVDGEHLLLRQVLRAVRPGQLPIQDGDGDLFVDIVVRPQRPPPVDEHLVHPETRRTELARHGAAIGADGDVVDPLRLLEPAGFRPFRRRQHEIVPDGSSRKHSRAIFHRRVVVVPHPDPRCQIGRVPDCPAVAVIVGGAGLGCHGAIGELQIPAGPAECGLPRFPVAQDAGDQVGVSRGNDLFLVRQEDFVRRFLSTRWSRRVLHEQPQQLAGRIPDALDRLGWDVSASGSQRGVSVGQLKQCGVATAQRQREPIRRVSFPGQSFHPKRAGGFQKAIEPHVLERFDRGDVVRISQRLPHGHHSMFSLVVVRGDVYPVRPIGEFCLHVHDRRGRGPPVLRHGESGKVHERLEGRAGLTRANRYVHLSTDVRCIVVHTPHHRQDFAGAGAYGDQGSVGGMIFFHFLDVLPHKALCLCLEPQVQGCVNL